jgi:RNA polymerase sigma-70 factor (ECF subfamily)
MPPTTDSTQTQGSLLEQWYGLYRNELGAYLRKHFKLPQDCNEDIVQNAFLRVNTNSSTINNPRVYLYRTVHNLAIDYLRQQSKQDSTQSTLENYLDQQEDRCPERALSAKQLMSLLNTVIWSMPEKRRQLFIMHRFEELSFAEIGRRTGLSESAVRKHIANALADCQRAMEAQNV